MVNGGRRTAPAMPLYKKNNRIYGAYGSTLVASKDVWQSVEMLTTIMSGHINNVHVTDNQTVLVTTAPTPNNPRSGSELWRMRFGNSPITPTKVYDFKWGTHVWRDSFTSKGNVVFAVDYGSNDGNIYRSTDDGQTWSMVWSIPQDEIIGGGHHIHTIQLDPYTDILWGGRGDTRQEIFFLEPPNYDVRTIKLPGHMPTAIEVTPDYVLFGNDENPINGITRYTKATDTFDIVLDLQGTEFNTPIFGITTDEKTGYMYAMNVGLAGQSDIYTLGAWRSSGDYSQWELIYSIPFSEIDSNGVQNLVGVIDGILLSAMGHRTGIRVSQPRGFGLFVSPQRNQEGVIEHA